MRRFLLLLLLSGCAAPDPAPTPLTVLAPAVEAHQTDDEQLTAQALACDRAAMVRYPHDTPVMYWDDPFLARKCPRILNAFHAREEALRKQQDKERQAEQDAAARRTLQGYEE